MWKAWSASATCRASRSQSEYTATVGRPISRHARITRTAISPRFATRTFISLILSVRGSGFDGSERDVPVLFGRVLIALGFEAGEGGDEFRAGLTRTDHFVDEPAG